MSKYKVEIVETLCKQVIVEAENRFEAISMIQEKYKNDEIELMPEDLVDVSYRAFIS